MIKIGIRAHDFGKRKPLDMALKVKSFGLDGIQLVINKALLLEDNLSKDLLKEVALTFNKHQIDIALLGAYFNPIHSNPDKRENNLRHFENTLVNAKLFNCNYVGTETGSYHDDKWIYHPDNHKEGAYQTVLTTFKKLESFRIKNQISTKIAIEGAFNHVIYNPKVMKRLLDELNSDDIRVIVDLYNFLNINNHEEHITIFKECINLFGPKIKIIHLKDYLVQDNQLVQVPVGKGLMDYNEIMKLIKQLPQDVYLIFEGTKETHLQESLKYITSR